MKAPEPKKEQPPVVKKTKKPEKKIEKPAEVKQPET
jgi:hypothetical protein